MTSPRLLEAMDEGDYEFVRTYLRGSVQMITWDLLALHPFVDLKVMAARQIQLKSIRQRLEIEVMERGRNPEPVL